MRKNHVLHPMRQENSLGHMAAEPPSREELLARLREEVRHAVDIQQGKSVRSFPSLPASPAKTRKARKNRDLSRPRFFRRAVSFSAPVKALPRIPKRLLFLTTLLLAIFLMPTQTSHFAVAADTAVAGNKNTQVFHNQNCQYYPRAKVWFEDRQKAVAQGYRPCGHCGG